MGAEDTSLGEAVLILSTDNNGFRMGIDDAQMAANAMQRNLDGMQNHVKDMFAEKFQHVGVHLFGMDMLRTIGITEGARPILGALQMGVSELAGAFGVAAGPLGLIIMGFTALAAIGWKVHESQQKHAETLAKVTKETDEAFKATDDLLGSLESYNTALKGVTPELDNLYEATKKLDAIERQRSSHLHGEAMAAAQQEIESLRNKSEQIRQSIADLKALDGTYDATSGVVAHYGDRIVDLNKKLGDNEYEVTKQNKVYEENKAAIDALGEGHQSLKDKLEAGKKAAEEHAKAVKAAADEYKKEEASIQHFGTIIAQIEQDGAAATTDSYAKKKAEIEKYRVTKQSEIDLLHKQVLANATSQDQILAANAQHAAANIALTKTVAEKTFENYTAIGQYAAAIGKSIETSFSQAAARTIVAHKDMHAQIAAISTQIKEQIVADAIKMGIEYGVQAVKGVLMHNAIALASAKRAQAEVASNVAVIASNKAKTASVAELTIALGVAEKAALALDLALAAAV